MNKEIKNILDTIEHCLKNNIYEAIETEIVELKPSLPNEKGKEAISVYQSINAFLNTQGGFLLLGIKDINNTIPKRYEFKGYKEEFESPIKAVENKFTTIEQRNFDVSPYIQYEIVDFYGSRVCIVYVNELPEDEKYLFFNKIAYKRVITGDTPIHENTIQQHEEYKEEIKNRRELLAVKNASINDISIDRLNDYIYQLNRKNQLHNAKPDVKSAMPFLIQKMFVLKNTEEVTTLGMLVCGSLPETFLGLRASVRAFLQTQIKAADDKDEFNGNILDLMRRSLSFVLKNIQIGITRNESGKEVAEYPEDLLSECINNALAHRDYKMNDYVRIVVRPNEHIEITNPGTFKAQLTIQETTHLVPFRRIIPASKPTNPNLAQVLSVFSKWEGLGNGMAGLVNAALLNKTDLPYYKFNTQDSLSLFITKGKLLDDEMMLLFDIYDGYIQQKLQGNPFTQEMKETFAYLYKSQWLNLKGYYTILLTSDNNHQQAILHLLHAQLIYRHPQSPKYHDVYMVDNAFIDTQYGKNMLTLFGKNYQNISIDSQELLQLIYQYNTFNGNKNITASKAGNILWFRKHKFVTNPKLYDAFKRKIRTQFNLLEKSKFIIRHGQSVHTNYVINHNYLTEQQAN
jgi:predicted HTH transcriptional regulator